MIATGIIMFLLYMIPIWALFEAFPRASTDADNNLQIQNKSYGVNDSSMNTNENPGENNADTEINKNHAEATRAKGTKDVTVSIIRTFVNIMKLICILAAVGIFITGTLYCFWGFSEHNNRQIAFGAGMLFISVVCYATSRTIAKIIRSDGTASSFTAMLSFLLAGAVWVAVVLIQNAESRLESNIRTDQPPAA